MNQILQAQEKLEWMEPESQELDARETAHQSGAAGVDGGNYSDCSAS